VTLNGNEMTEEKIKFFYYPDIKIAQVKPNVGPVSGGTISNVGGVGFNHPNICKPRVKYGAIEVIPEQKDGYYQVTSPKVAVPDAVTLFPSGNG
jgi:hypothetical protein